MVPLQPSAVSARINPLAMRRDQTIRFHAFHGHTASGKCEAKAHQPETPWQFFTSKETFYRFWAGIITATLSGFFLIGTTILRSHLAKNGVEINTLSDAFRHLRKALIR